jgi:hypothetical protein
MRSWVQYLMDMCINVLCPNAIYKHVHCGEWLQKLFAEKIEKKLLNFFLMTCHAMIKMQLVTLWSE